jgi:teichuronic acid biosynthesis glycosyltransferase TuaH
LKIVILLHTDWNWIKQRTQFLSEELAHIFTLRVFSKFSFRRKTLVKNKSEVEYSNMPIIPFRFQLTPIIRELDSTFWGICFGIYCRLLKVDKVIFTHPLLYRYLKFLPSRVEVVFDLHDDNAEFYEEGKFKEFLNHANKIAIKASDKVITSSEHLRRKFVPRNLPKRVIRNGHQIQLTGLKFDSNNEPRNNIELFYFGSISEWFDFELLEYIVENVENINVTIIGPSDVKLFKHPRITYTGPLMHEEMLKCSSKADIFIMPFQVNELIEGVDPVKLYEYLSFQALVIAPAYDELNHFGEFIKLYKNHKEAINYILNFKELLPTEKEMGLRMKFLERSTWSSRSHEYAQVLHES